MRTLLGTPLLVIRQIQRLQVPRFRSFLASQRLNCSKFTGSVVLSYLSQLLIGQLTHYQIVLLRRLLSFRLLLVSLEKIEIGHFTRGLLVFESRHFEDLFKHFLFLLLARNGQLLVLFFAIKLALLKH